MLSDHIRRRFAAPPPAAHSFTRRSLRCTERAAGTLSVSWQRYRSSNSDFSMCDLSAASARWRPCADVLLARSGLASAFDDAAELHQRFPASALIVTRTSATTCLLTTPISALHVGCPPLGPLSGWLCGIVAGYLLTSNSDCADPASPPVRGEARGGSALRGARPLIQAHLDRRGGGVLRLAVEPLGDLQVFPCTRGVAPSFGDRGEFDVDVSHV